MAFFSINRESFKNLVLASSQISPKRSDIEIFTYSKITVNTDSLSIQSINNNSYFSDQTSVFNSDIDKNIDFLIKTDILKNTLLVQTDENLGIEIDLEKHLIYIQGSRNKQKLRIDTELLTDFILPELPVEFYFDLEIDSVAFYKSLKVAQISVGNPKNVYNPELLNICLTVKPEEKGLYIVSTDRYRISKTKLAVNNLILGQKSSQDVDTNFLINPRVCSLLMNIFTDSKINLLFAPEGLVIKSNKTEMFARYGEGKYPDYNKIIPQSFACSFNLDTKEFINAIKQTYYLVRETTVNKSVTLEIDPATSTMRLHSQTTDGYSSETNIEFNGYEGLTDKWSQTFNADYLLDYINLLDSETFLWQANPGKPSILSPTQEDANQIYLIGGLN